MTRLIRNLGLEMTDLGFFSSGSTPQERAKVERRVCEALDAGIPCSLLNMENQLITGYDDTGFFIAQPWAPRIDFPPARLTFGSWEEFGDSFHATFHTLKSAPPAERRRAILDGLDYAVDLHTNPGTHSLARFGIGPDAYVNWMRAAPEYGGSHGNWWNATVWSECRQMAARFFADVGQRYTDAARAAHELTVAYAGIGAALDRLSEKTMDVAVKVKLLAETQEQEAAAIKKVAALTNSLRSGAQEEAPPPGNGL